MARKKHDMVLDEVQAFLYMTPEQRESAEARLRWLSLWEQQFVGEKMAEADVGYADLMTYFGERQAMADGDYATALGYLDTFFAHPLVEQAEHVTLMQLRCDRMLCLLHLGRETEAMEMGRTLLSYARRSELRTALLILRDPLYMYLLQAEPEQVATVELTEFVWDVAQVLRFRKRRILPVLATFGQLADTLNQTWPPAKRERIREVIR